MVRSETTRFWLPLLILLFVGAGVRAGAGTGPEAPSENADWPGGKKISDWILTHQRTKALPPGRSEEEHRRAIRKKGLNADRLDAEAVALYVRERLGASEIEDLAARGVQVHPSVWVPPVEARHPLGYHLATVRYDSLDGVQEDDRIVHLESVEFAGRAQNDVAVAMIGAAPFHTGAGILQLNGEGVRIAVADSGIDLSHLDLPNPIEAFDVTDGSSIETWGSDVSNTVIDHGTHVSASAVGSGLRSASRYRGSAPGASLYFYKIGDDDRGWATWSDMIEAIDRASSLGVDVLSISYGGLSTYMDGSGPTAQAIDAAFDEGTVTFVSAGNERDEAKHYSTLLQPGTTTPLFRLSVIVEEDDEPDEILYLGVIWRGSVPADAISLSCTNLNVDAGESLEETFADTSARGTRARWYNLTTALAPGARKTYNLRLQSTATGGGSPRVHVYYDGYDSGSFDDADSDYTVTDPALADTAMAVAAWTHRTSWTNYQGESYRYSDTRVVDTLAPFSGAGPRIDGLRKPDIAAPGSATISARDSGTHIRTGEPLAGDVGSIINDYYYVSQGTSMACPMAAGAAALLLQAEPSLTPGELRSLLTSTAENARAPDNLAGYGLIDVGAAVETLTFVWSDINGSGRVDGFDLVEMALAFGARRPEPRYASSADLDRDGQVDGDDLSILASFFGRPIPQIGAAVAAGGGEATSDLSRSTAGAR